MPCVRRGALPPVMGSEYRSPRRSNTSVFPSGETSSEIQVPFVVVKVWVRAVLSGSPAVGGLDGVAPGASCAASEDDAATTAASEARERRRRRMRMLGRGQRPSGGDGDRREKSRHCYSIEQQRKGKMPASTGPA